MAVVDNESPKNAYDSFELPCGFVDADGKLHTHCEIKEMTGVEEEILAAKNMTVPKKFHRILSNCITYIGPYKGDEIDRILPELTQGDRLFLLFAIRRVTLGNEMPFITKCSECNKESQLTIDLSELEIKKMPDPMVRTYDVVLPKSKKQVRMKVLNGRGEDAISRAVQSGVDIISNAILARIDAIDGQPPSISVLKSLGLADRNFLKSAWETREGGVDTGVEITCSYCGSEYETDVNIGDSGFFSPETATQKFLKTRSSI
jgi:hypothetical protein